MTSEIKFYYCTTKDDASKHFQQIIPHIHNSQFRIIKDVKTFRNIKNHSNMNIFLFDETIISSQSFEILLQLWKGCFSHNSLLLLNYISNGVTNVHRHYVVTPQLLLFPYLNKVSKFRFTHHCEQYLKIVATSPQFRLTAREVQVLYHFTKGADMQSICKELKITSKTVSSHKINIMHKYEMVSFAQVIDLLVEYANYRCA